MNKDIFAKIDFARYQRWLNRVSGSDVVFIVFDGAGAPIWGDQIPQVQEFGQAISSATGNTDAAMCRLDIENKNTLLYQQLGYTNEGLIGWAAVVVDYFKENDAPVEVDHLVEAMEDLVAEIGEEFNQKKDFEFITNELGARYEELHLVYAVDKHVQMHSGENTKVFQNLLQSATEHLNVDVVAFVQPSKDVYLYATALSREIHNLDLVLVEMRGDLYRFVQASGETVVLNAMNDPRRAYIFTDLPYKVLASPVHADGRVDALVVLLNHLEKPDFSNSDRKLGEVLANQLSSLSNSFQLIKDMEEFNQQLAMTLIEAVEAKDPYTRGHSERVNFLSMEIGRAMDLSIDELEDLHWGSLLHDVGKIGIPDAVLCKPSKLTKDEYTFIMVHPERSYEILRHIKHLEKAVLGARHHQEMYDGKGYPHGLKGHRIPLHGRIIAVADTYDSITSSRAYRAGRSHEVAMKELDRVAGTQLDPEIVEVFKKLCESEPEWLVRFNIRREKAAA